MKLQSPEEVIADLDETYTELVALMFEQNKAKDEQIKMLTITTLAFCLGVLNTIKDRKEAIQYIEKVAETIFYKLK